MKRNLLALFPLVASLCLGACSSNSGGGKKGEDSLPNPTLSFSFESTEHGYTKDNASGKNYYIDYVFNEENADELFKKPNDPVQKQGVSGKSLYMDGFSTHMTINDYKAPTSKLTVSAWVAPR